MALWLFTRVQRIFSPPLSQQDKRDKDDCCICVCENSNVDIKESLSSLTKLFSPNNKNLYFPSKSVPGCWAAIGAVKWDQALLEGPRAYQI